jgi:hypothetical protein
MFGEQKNMFGEHSTDRRRRLGKCSARIRVIVGDDPGDCGNGIERGSCRLLPEL